MTGIHPCLNYPVLLVAHLVRSASLDCHTTKAWESNVMLRHGPSSFGRPYVADCTLPWCMFNISVKLLNT